jgi:hypothetical protein
LNFSQPSTVTFVPSELGGHKGLDNLTRDFQSDDARAQTEHIHIVVFNALMGRIVVMA